jgi:hypothetical protein
LETHRCRYESHDRVRSEEFQFNNGGTPGDAPQSDPCRTVGWEHFDLFFYDILCIESIYFCTLSIVGIGHLCSGALIVFVLVFCQTYVVQLNKSGNNVKIYNIEY